jgi:hypothetical protein
MQLDIKNFGLQKASMTTSESSLLTNKGLLEIIIQISDFLQEDI